MPIIRTYGCPRCGHFLEVTLTAEQWDSPAPECPACAARQMQQEFKAPGIVGSPRSKAVKLAETIAEQDYGVTNITSRGEGERPKVSYKRGDSSPSAWGVTGDALEAAVAQGRQTRQKYGSSLDIIKSMPDLIEESKNRMR